jgi:hypothetical protein
VIRSTVPMSARPGDTRRVRRLRLMADYECHPLWAAGGNLDPWTLGLPADLAEALSTWAADYTATLNQSDPRVSGFTDEPSARAWLAQGETLASRLRQEGFAVDYFHQDQKPGDLVADA